MNTNTTVIKRNYNGRPLRPKAERVYVRVNSDFDATGYMLPRSIIWDDGREFRIEKVQDYKAATPLNGRNSDCYTVLIHGEEKHLFFERVDSTYRSRVGRWYVEKLVIA